MNMTVVKGGKFTFSIEADKLTKGLRNVKNNPRNSDYLIECIGAVGFDKALQALESLTRLDTSVITDGFPFPQLFVLSRQILLCGSKKIYELQGSSFSLVYTASVAGGLWSVVDFFDYLYLSNGRIAVVRSAQTGTFSLSTTLPSATTICNYNGQVLIGAPNKTGLGANQLHEASAITMSVTQEGRLR